MTVKSSQGHAGAHKRGEPTRHARYHDPTALERTRVVKTLKRGQPGSQRWVERHGERLICVRYREDPEALQRYVTVELLVDAKPIKPAAVKQRDALRPATAPVRADRAEDGTRFVHVRIEVHEEATRRRAYEAGATCARGEPIWQMPLATARALRLLRRIVDVQS